MDVPSSTVCIPLRDSAMCSSFGQFTAYIPANVAYKVKTVADFDTLMRESIDLSSGENATGFGSLIASDNGYNCSGFTGGLRYLQSTLCGYFVGLAQGTCAERVPKLPLCLGTADAFFASWGGVLGNQSVCQNGPGQAADLYKNALMASMQGILNSDLDCLVAQSPETGTCGFSSTKEASSFCASNSDTCCSTLALNASVPFPGNSTAFANKSVSTTIPSSTSTSLTTSNLEATSSQNATIISGASGNSKARQTQTTSSNQADDQSQTSKTLPLAAIISASVAGLVLIITGIVAIRYSRRRSDNIEDANPPVKGNSPVKSVNNDAFPASAARMPVPFVAPIPVSSDRGGQTAVRPYSPVLDDELYIVAGDEIIVDTKYEDGWAYGHNLRTRKNGVFPVSIFEDLPMNFDAGNDGDRSTIVESLYSKRASSLYIAPSTLNKSSMNRVVSANQKFDSVYTRASTVPSKSTMSSMYSRSDSGNIHTVLHAFKPALDDEIELRDGDRVQVDCEYDDGWGYGINFKTNREGLFPLDCLDGFSEGGVKVDARARSIRVSSVFGNTDYFVFLDQSTATPAFSNVSSFDSYMKLWADNSPEFASQMQTQYSCPGWTTTTLALRYHLTAYCGIWAYIGSTVCPAQQGASPQMSPVCRDPVMDFVSSWNKLMNNSTICSSNPTTEVSKRRDTYLGLFTELLKGGLSNQGCTIAVAADAGSFCGFQTAQEGQSWCDQNHDVCCAFNSQLKQVLPAPLETSAVPTPSRTSDSNVSGTGSGSGVPIVPIAIGGGIALILIIAILTCCVWRATPAKRRSHASPAGLHRAPSFEMRSNDGGAVKSWDEQPQMDAYSNSQFQQQQNMRHEVSSSRNSYYKPVVPQVGANKWGVPLSPSVAMNVGVVGDPRVKNYWVVVNFRPENPDEMPLVIGDVVTIQQIYDDDWCFGRNLSKQIEGIFPFECVAESPNAKSAGVPSKNKFNRRESSLYGESNNQPADDGSFKVIFAYYPSMADEIELHIGDRAAVVESYDDGWAFGVNMTTRAEGLFPLDILENYTSQTPMGDETLRRIRESSRYSTFSTLKKPISTPQPVLNLKNTTPQPSFPVQKQNASPQPTFPQKQPVPQPQPFPPSAAAISVPSFAGKSYFVIYDFKPIQPDEVTLRVGDRVTIKQNYDDGWALGLNITTKLEGLFPLDTLAIDASRETLQRKNRQSSIYESQSLANGSERVVYDFLPERPDEIKLRVGDEVVVNQEFDDGWAFGVNITTNEEGNFPLDCLSSYTEPQASVASSKKPKQRVSSIYETSTDAATGEKVIYDFNPERPDEIELRVGDVVVIAQSFDDGWAIGTNLRTKQEGNFPLDCLAGTAEPATAAKDQRSRQSSLYDANNTNSLYTMGGLKTTDSYYAANTNSVYSAAGTNTNSIYGTTASQSILPRSDTAIFDFKPERPDEIELRKGDTVVVQQEFDDGWGFGVNNRTNKKGNFPCDCLSSYADPSGTMPTLKSKHRVSSVYGDSEYGPDEQLPVPPIDVANLGSDEVAHSYTTTKADEVPLSVGDR
ncbi:hypothetical protein CcCBS67573_g09500, partial [Chytriomyces confervae]